MTLPLSSRNQLVNSETSSSARSRKLDKETGNQSGFLLEKSSIQWNSNARLQIYSHKLSQALRHLRMTGGSASSKQRVRDAANNALARTAKGRSRWSRAIFASGVKPKLLKKNTVVSQQRKLTRLAATGNRRLMTKKSNPTLSSFKSKDLPAFQRSARLLRRLIPGCRKQPLHVTLEETIDYIPALEMQVRAMSALVHLLSTTGSSSPMPSNDPLVRPDSNPNPPN